MSRRNEREGRSGIETASNDAQFTRKYTRVVALRVTTTMLYSNQLYYLHYFDDIEKQI